MRVLKILFCWISFFLLSAGAPAQWCFGPTESHEIISGTVSQWDFASSKFIYEPNDDGGMTIVGYTGDCAYINIPDVIDGKIVTGMSDALFEGETIGTIIIPATCINIPSRTWCGVTDTTRLIYKGTFENFWGYIFPGLIKGFQETIDGNYNTASVPTTIEVENVSYVTNKDNFSVGQTDYSGKSYGSYVYYYTNGLEKRYTKSTSRSSFYYINQRKGRTYKDVYVENVTK